MRQPYSRRDGAEHPALAAPTAPVTDPGAGRCYRPPVTLTTLAVYPLKDVAPAVSTGVVYLLPVLASRSSGTAPGLLTAVISAVSFNFFHIEPPAGDSRSPVPENIVALVIFLVAAVIARASPSLSRNQAMEADRRREADITADMARILWAVRGRPKLCLTLPSGSPRPASTGRNSRSTRPIAEAKPICRSPLARPERAPGSACGSRPPDHDLGERIVPSIEALLEAAIQRDVLQDETVETRALRRSDVMKTALIRTVSHDLRSPLAGIVASGEALSSAGLHRRREIRNE